MSRMAEQQLYIHGGYTSATSGRTFEISKSNDTYTIFQNLFLKYPV